MLEWPVEQMGLVSRGDVDSCYIELYWNGRGVQKYWVFDTVGEISVVESASNSDKSFIINVWTEVSCRFIRKRLRLA